VSGDATYNVSGSIKFNGMGGASIASGTGIALKAPGGVVLPSGSLSVAGGMVSGAGVTGTFTSVTGEIIHVQKGIVTNIT
jgi:hypothetical protein